MYAAYRQSHYYSKNFQRGSQDPLEVLSIHATLEEAQAAAEKARGENQPEDGIIRLGHNQASADTFGAAELTDDAGLAAMKGLEYGSEAWAAWCNTEDAGWLTDAGRYEFLIVGDEFVAATEYGEALINAR